MCLVVYIIVVMSAKIRKNLKYNRCGWIRFYTFFLNDAVDESCFSTIAVDDDVRHASCHTQTKTLETPYLQDFQAL